MMKYIFHEDPGHGWLEVTRSELKNLGILKKISHFSYQNGDNVYLEEDDDAFVFINAKKENGEKVEIDFRFCNDYSEIRNYPSFSYHS